MDEEAEELGGGVGGRRRKRQWRVDEETGANRRSRRKRGRKGQWRVDEETEGGGGNSFGFIFATILGGNIIRTALHFLWHCTADQ